MQVHDNLVPLVLLVFLEVLIARREELLGLRSSATPGSSSEQSRPPGSGGIAKKMWDPVWDPASAAQLL